jgi:hypothetical protein
VLPDPSQESKGRGGCNRIKAYIQGNNVGLASILTGSVTLRSRVRLQMLTVIQIVEKLSAFYETRKIFTVLAKTRRWILS